MLSSAGKPIYARHGEEDRLATLIAVQAHSVKNTRHLIVALIQHTFTQLLPMPLPPSTVGLSPVAEEEAPTAPLASVP